MVRTSNAFLSTAKYGDWWCRKLWAEILHRVHASPLQHGVLSGVSAQLDVVASTLQRTPPLQLCAGVDGYQGPAACATRVEALLPFPACADMPKSEVSASPVAFAFAFACMVMFLVVG
jgi:hypothetical protein